MLKAFTSTFGDPLDQLGVIFFFLIVAHSGPTLCDPMDCSLPGSSIHGILQAEILGQVAIPFSMFFPTQGLNPSPGLQEDSFTVRAVSLP